MLVYNHCCFLQCYSNFILCVVPSITYNFFQEAKEILCDADQRKNYDKWRNSGIAISYKNWKDMKDHVHQVNEEKFVKLSFLTACFHRLHT